MANNSREEPSSAPQSGRWFDLTLGPSFASDSSSKFCTLRYEFKPASIDKTKAGSLHKTTENRVTVEFQNNQLGRPKVTFDGSSEDYKENDAVLFFDGRTFRLERLHRAVKQLRLRRDPGESAAAVADPSLSPGPKGAKPMSKAWRSAPPVPVEVERIDIGEPENAGAKAAGKGITDHQPEPPNVSATSPGLKEVEAEDHLDIDIDNIFGESTPDNDEKMAEQKAYVDIDNTAPQQNESDDEIADVENSGDEAEKGPNAAEALRAQVSARERDGQSSSSGSSSESGSSGSGSGSSSSSGSSDSEGSDEDSVNSI